MTTIVLPTDFQGRTINAQRVYTKTVWTDDWTEQPAVVCTSATWEAAPTIPQATFYYRYGVGSVNGDAIAVWSKFELPTYGYVKVELDAVDLTVDLSDPIYDPEAPEYDPDAPPYETTIKWFGVVVSKDDLLEGEDVVYSAEKTPSGRQVFYAVGFEYLLNQCYVRMARAFEEGQAEAEDIYCVPTFNFRNTANRSDNGVTDTNLADQASFIFHIPKRDGSATLVPKYWSTKDIVQYLLCWCTPLASDDLLKLPFALYDTHGILPNWDRPVIAHENQRLLTILNSLMARQRGLSFRFEVDEVDEGTDVIVLIPFSLREASASNGSLGGTWTANADLIDLDLRYTAGVTLKDDGHSRFDKVTVIGGRVIYVWTTGQTDTYNHLRDEWGSVQESLYSTAVSAHDDYDTWAAASKKILDSLSLAGPAVKDVFTRYSLDFEKPPQKKNFPPLDSLASTATTDSEDMRYWFERPILTWVPFNVGVDYTSGSATYDWDLPTESIIPFATTTIDESGDDVDMVFDMRHGALAAGIDEAKAPQLGFTVNVVANQNPREFELYVSGTLPHMVGFGGDAIGRDFGDLSGVPIEKITMAIEGDRFTEVSQSTGNSVEAVRERLIDVGDLYRVIVAVKDTAFDVTVNTGTGVDPTTLKTISATKIIRDDRPYMEAIASAAIAWYGVDRRALSWSTKVATTSLFVGQLVEKLVIGDPPSEMEDPVTEDVNTVITSIRMNATIGGLGQSPVTSWDFMTQFSEVDVV